LDNPEMKMYFYLLNDVLEPMNEFNTAFQVLLMNEKIYLS